MLFAIGLLLLSDPNKEDLIKELVKLVMEKLELNRGQWGNSEKTTNTLSLEGQKEDVVCLGG